MNEWPCWKREPHPPHRPWVTSSGGGHFLGDEEPDEATKRTERNVRQVWCPGVDHVPLPAAVPPPPPDRAEAYEDALRAVAAAAVTARGRVSGFHLAPGAGEELLVRVESALSALIAVGFVPSAPNPGRRPLLNHEPPRPRR